MAECATCGRQGDDATVCASCARRVAGALHELAGLAGELDVTIARLGRSGTGGRGSDRHPIPVDLGAAADAAAVGNALTTWARHIESERGVPAPTVGERDHQALAEVARWLAGQCEWLRHRPEADEALDELADACRLAVRIVDRRTPRWYAGKCTAMVTRGASE